MSLYDVPGNLQGLANRLRVQPRSAAANSPILLAEPQLPDGLLLPGQGLITPESRILIPGSIPLNTDGSGLIIPGGGLIAEPPGIPGFRPAPGSGLWLPEGVEAPANAPRQFWAKSKTFNGNKVFQRDDLIDPMLIDSRGRTNLERMQKGLAPIGPDGESINLHHLIQTQDGAIAEVTQTFHQQNYGTLHINPNTVPSGIDRNAFDAWKRRYWMYRVNDFGESP